jgi:hypothetical protein
VFRLLEPKAMIDANPIAPSPVWGRGDGPEARPGIEPSGRGCSSEPPRNSRNPSPSWRGGGQITFYAAILHGRSYLREFTETSLLIFGVSILLYVLGLTLGSLLGIKQLS